MELQLIGPHPLARDEQGRQLTRIGTLFVEDRVLVTQGPGVHAWQRLNYIDYLNSQRADQGLPLLSSAEEERVCAESVDLIFEPDHILIRPDPQRIQQTFAADELLHGLVSKREVKFLSVSDARIRGELKRRGEFWRLSSLPKTRNAQKKLVASSKVAIHGLPIYYYNRLTGTRWLTYQEFEGLGGLEPAGLAQHLYEIGKFASRLNRLGRPEVDFFAADLRLFGAAEFARALDLPAQGLLERPEELKARYEELRARFRSSVHEAYLRDDPGNKAWCERMVSTLFLEGNEAQTEHILSGLSPEFYMRIEWLPGGRFEEGEFLLDPIFEEASSAESDGHLERLCDPRAKEIILNFIRDYGDLEYINLGCVPESLSLDRPQREGRRAVYLAEFKLQNEAEPVRRFLRLQKWGVWEHLDEGKELLESILESDEYTDYTLDRRLGCRQLGMNLCRRAVMRRLNEIYRGTNSDYHGRLIRTTYFERDYIPGIATDKLPLERYARPGYAAQFAALLGRAAVSSLIVGRSLEGTRPAFDDGDEVVCESENGLPTQILVADQSGAFTEYELPLESFASDYARPVNVRESVVPQSREFARTYLDAFSEQFLHIQGDYRKRRRAFENLFRHCKYDPNGSFAFRWECVLRRLDQTDLDALRAKVGQHIRALNSKVS